MINKLWIVAKREYLSTVRRPTFWLSTLAIPAMIVFFSGISIWGQQAAEDTLKGIAEKADRVAVVDQAGIIAPSLLQTPFHLAADKTAAVEQVRSGELPVAIVYPADVISSPNIEIYTQDAGLLGNGAFNDAATGLLQQSILARLGDPQLAAAYSAAYDVNVTAYSNGAVVERRFTDFIVPGVTVVLYFLLVMFSSSYLLQSVSQEKENRMIEILIANVTPRQLIWGKIIGQVGIVFTQLTVLMGLSALALMALRVQLPIDLTGVVVTPGQILFGLFYLLTGFLIMAGVMVGVGAAMPSYRDAQNFSTVFIFAAIMPVYFAAAIIADPNSTIALVGSYFPFSAPMVLAFRYAINAMTVAEIIFSSLVVVFYVLVSFYLAFKAFELGSLEYSQKISLRSFLLGIRPG